MTYPELFRLASFVALFLLLVVSAYTDLTRNKVYNWATLPGLGLGLAFAYLAGGIHDQPAHNLVNSLMGVAAGGGIFLVFSLFGAMGLGDVKLMAAVGALTGVPFVLVCLLFSSMVGFVMAMGVLIWRGRVGEGLARSVKFAFRWKKEKRSLEAGESEAEQAGRRRPADTIPFGAAIAFGTLSAFVLSVPKT